MRSNAPMRSLSTMGGTPDKSRIVIGTEAPSQSLRSSSRSLATVPLIPGRQSPGLKRNSNCGSRSLEPRIASCCRMLIGSRPQFTRSLAGPVVLTVRYSGGVTDMASPSCTGFPMALRTYADSTSSGAPPGFGMIVRCSR